MGNLDNSRERVRGSWSELQRCWADVREQWRDPVAERFEREWWRQIEEVVPRVLDAMTELDDLISRALADTDAED